MMLINPYVFGGSAPPPGGHRYWRINNFSTHGGAYYRVGEIAFRTISGGSSATTPGNGTASQYNTYYAASRAFDLLLTANVNDAAGFMGVTQQWIMWDFGVGNEHAIVECEVWNSDTSNGSELDQHLQSYEVQWSDNGTSWTTVASEATHPRTASASTVHSW